jgi:hypothetical protein
LEDSFSPADIGRRIGFSKPQSEITARLLADAGVLELGFDCTASFSPEYQEMKAASDPKPRRKRPRS